LTVPDPPPISARSFRWWFGLLDAPFDILNRLASAHLRKSPLFASFHPIDLRFSCPISPRAGANRNAVIHLTNITYWNRIPQTPNQLGMDGASFTRCCSEAGKSHSQGADKREEPFTEKAMQKTRAGLTGKSRRLRFRSLSARPVRQGGALSSLRAEDSASADLHRVVRCPAAGPQEAEIVRSSEPAQMSPSPDNSPVHRSIPRDSGMTAIMKRGGLSVLSIGAERLPSVVVIGCRPVRVPSCSGRLFLGTGPFWK